jgi:hypothetical protein
MFSKIKDALRTFMFFIIALFVDRVYFPLFYKIVHEIDQEEQVLGGYIRMSGRVVARSRWFLFVRRLYALEPYMERAAKWVVDSPFKFAIGLGVLGAIARAFGLGSWAAWLVIAGIQNIAFTFSSRARNSGSIMRHAFAALASNFTYALSFALTFKEAEYLTGKHGFLTAILACFLYATASVTGGIIAHAYALRTEKGLSAVGASKKLAQITVEEYERMAKDVKDALDRLAFLQANVLGTNDASN